MRFLLKVHDRKWSAIALDAEPKEKELMPGCSKAARQLRLERRDAPLKLIQFFALIALEVMVMFFSGYLISRRIAGNLYRLQPAIIDQGLNISINGRDPEGRVMQLCSLPGLFRG